MAAKYLYSLDNTQPMVVNIKTSAAVKDGDIVAITSGLITAMTAADTGIVGIANGDTASGGIAQVTLLSPMSVIRVPYVGTTKTTLADADKWGTAFDWDDTNKKLNLDDTTGGMLKVVNYNNTAKTADVTIGASALWN